MPYKYPDDVPDRIRGLPEAAQKIWIEVFNSAIKTYDGDEGKANATAWVAVKNAGYKQSAEGKWIEAERFQKDLLYPGITFSFDGSDEKITITEDNIKEITENTMKFLDLGGNIPITFSHPGGKTKAEVEKEKMKLVAGWLDNVFIDDATKTLIGEFNADDEATKLIKEDKVKAMSPCIAYDVLNSQGHFPSIIEHVALTNSPYILGQKEFVSLMAEKFTSATIFFEGGKSGYQKFGNGGAMEELKKLLETFFVKIENLFSKKEEPRGGIVPQKGKEESDMEELEKLKGQYAELETRFKLATDELDAFREAEKKVAMERLEVKKKEFEASVKVLEDDGKILPAERPTVMAMFETIKSPVKVGDKELTAEEVILAPFKVRESKFVNKLSTEMDRIRVNEIEFDISTIEGKNKLSDHIMETAKKENKSYEETRKVFFENLKK